MGPVVVLEAAGRLSDVVEDLDLAVRFALAEEPAGWSATCPAWSMSARRAHCAGSRAPAGTRGTGPVSRWRWPGSCREPARTLSGKTLGGHLMVTASLREALSSVLQASLPAVESRSLAPHPTAPRASRDFVSATLLDWRLSQLIPDACLVVSELVTNAMIHAGSDIELTVSEHRRAVRVAVRDRSPDLPVERHGLDTHGRGLTIVADLSRAWGVLPHADGGKVVWAVLDATPRPQRVTRRPRTRPALRREWGLR